MPPSPTSISCICTNLAYCRYASLRAASGSSPPARTIYLMRGARHTVPRFSRLVVIAYANCWFSFDANLARNPLLLRFTKYNIVNVSFFFPVERVVFGA